MVEHGEAVYTLEELLAEYGDMIYRIAMHNMRHKADAEDIVQDIYIKLLHNMPSFQNAEMQKKWIIRVTINTCHDRWRYCIMSENFRRNIEMSFICIIMKVTVLRKSPKFYIVKKQRF